MTHIATLYVINKTLRKVTSYFQDIEYHLTKYLAESKERILIAVAWFTNTRISTELIKRKNLEIDIVLDDNEINRNSKAVKDLIFNKINVYFIKDLNKNYYLMHNKFCVIDNKIAITGSYNWTFNSNSNDENITVISDKKTATIYNLEFSKIKNKKFLIDRISFSKEEMDNITKLIKKDLIELLKKNIDSLEQGMFVEFSNNSIKNKIRSISERINITLKGKVGSLGIYQDLIAKYGIEFNNIATEKEKANSRDLFAKGGVDKTEYYLHFEFQLIKLRAIDKIVTGYLNILKKNEGNKESTKIVKIVDFVIREKVLINKELKKVTLYNTVNN